MQLINYTPNSADLKEKALVNKQLISFLWRIKAFHISLSQLYYQKKSTVSLPSAMSHNICSVGVYAL